MTVTQNLISIEKLTKKAGGKILFTDMTLGICGGEKIALIGNNGCGKSTLLKTIAGILEPDEGRIARKNGLEIAYLEQLPEAKEDQTILDFVMESDSPLFKLVKRFEEASSKLAADTSDSAMMAYASLTEEMNLADAWNLENRIKSTLQTLGLSDHTLFTTSLSGGMLKKAAIARAMVQESPVLFLDEPTNHLDIETISWLEEELKSRKQTLILVTHDRYFLNNICTKIIEIDEGKLFQYDGNYQFYMQEKEARSAHRLKSQERLNTILRTELEWLKRGPKARTGKDSARKTKIFQMMDQRATQKSEIAASNAKSESFSVEGRRQGSKVLKIDGISKSYESRQVVKPFSFEFSKGDRIGIVGPNGSGKTTFLNLISQKVPSDSGSFDFGKHTHIAHFDQLSMELPKKKRVLEWFEEMAQDYSTNEGTRITPSLYLERFLFPKEQYHSLIGDLSGGEQRRIYLLSLLLENPNFLILDEPTNDLDIQTLGLLEEFLLEFKGTLLIVSHDRYFLDRTVNTLFCLDKEGNIQGFAGDISEYQSYLKEKKFADAPSRETTPKTQPKATAEAAKAEAYQPKPKKKGLSFNEKREYEQIEPRLEALETEKADLEAFFASGKNNPATFAQKQERYGAVEAEIETLMLRWEELESKI